MTQPLWTEVDRYLADLLLPADPALDAVLAANQAAGLPPHDVAANQGKLLHLLARLAGAKRILEIGTLGGYSTVWLARALPRGGMVVTLEADPQHAAVARANLARAGVADRVDLREGAALESLPALAGDPPFDMVFIDADKPNNPAYLDWAVRLSRPGTLVVADNVVRGGAILDEHSADARVQGIRHFFETLAADPRLDATALQTVGAKGHDGFALALVRHGPPG
ncbi:MAG: methyltransferase [Alphaproteobacteria bacterium]|nr:methyltransferase [Alphaproteobacteria bacterium]